MEVHQRKPIVSVSSDTTELRANKPLVSDEQRSTISSPSRQSLAAYTVENVFWLTAALVCVYVTEFPQVVLYDPRVDRFWLHVGYLFTAVNLSIGAYLILWLSVLHKVPSARWETHSPASIPTAAISFSMAAICYLLALWPVFWWLTLPILFVLFMGVIVLITLIPQFGAG